MADETEVTATLETEAEVKPVETPTESPWFQKIWDAEQPGKFVAKWQETLPQDMEDHKAMLANFGDFPTLVKSLKDNMTQARSKAGVKPLSEKSTPEEVAAYRKELGIPDKPYEFQKPEKLPDGIDWPEERVKTFGAWAQERNLTPAQAKDALDLHMQFLSEDQQKMSTARQQQMEQAIAAEKEQLKTQFGNKLPAAVVNAQRVASKYGVPPEMMEPGSDNFAGVTLLRMASDLAAALGEAQLPTHAAVFNQDPAREYQSITKNKSDPRHALWASGDPYTVKQAQDFLKAAIADRNGG